MKTDALGRGDDLLFVMGWGNRVDGTNERWFAEQLADEGYRVTLVELPTNPADFDQDYLAPLADMRDGLDSPTVVAHSTGGLIRIVVTIYRSSTAGSATTAKRLRRSV